jgi:hypothetical protein
LFDRADLEAHGFEGWQTVHGLRAQDVSPLPKDYGVYVVVRPAATRPTFLPASVGGRFKGKDPSVPVERLRAKWIDAATTFYIGKAESQTIRTRVTQLLDFGAGRPVGHWGGRYLWQLGGAERLLVAWRVHDRPEALENEMLSAFKARWGAFPFANIAGPRGSVDKSE